MPDLTTPASNPAIKAEKFTSEAERLEKTARKFGVLEPPDRYRALVNAVEASQDLIELADKKARFALVIMSVLNAVAVLLVVRGGNAVIPRGGVLGILVPL